MNSTGFFITLMLLSSHFGHLVLGCFWATKLRKYCIIVCLFFISSYLSCMSCLANRKQRSEISRLVYVFSGGTSSTSSATSPLMTPVSGVASGNSTSNGGEPRPQPQPSTSRGGSSSSFRYHSFIT